MNGVHLVMRVTVKITLSVFYAVRSIFSFIWVFRRLKPDLKEQSPGPTQKSAPGEQEKSPQRRKTPAPQTHKNPNESPSGHPAATPLKHDSFRDEHPDDAPPHEPSEQPAPRSHASYANDAPNRP